MRSTVIFLSLVLGLLLLSPIFAQEAEIEELYNKGLREYELGHYEEAAKHFEAFLAKEPNSKTVLKLLDQSSTRPLVDMYQNKYLRGIAARILRIPSQEIRKIKTDDERTQELVKELLRSQFETTEQAAAAIRDAQEKLIVIGAPAIPFMVDYLGVANAETVRTTIVVTINGIGEEAGLPLIQGLRHDNPLVRANVASLLGLIDDIRAVPALKALHENDDNKVVLESCEKALFRITKKTVAELPEARLLFMQQADDYLHRDPRVMRVFLDDLHFAFTFNKAENKIRRSEIADYIWNLEMAEECAYRALSIPGQTPDKDVYPLMANIYYNQLNVLDGLIKDRLARGISEDSHKEELNKLKAHRTNLRKANAFGPIFGTDTLHEALQQTIEDQNAYVAEVINDHMIKIRADIQHIKFLKLPAHSLTAHEAEIAKIEEKVKALKKQNENKFEALPEDLSSDVNRSLLNTTVEALIASENEKLKALESKISETDDDGTIETLNQQLSIAKEEIAALKDIKKQLAGDE